MKTISKIYLAAAAFALAACAKEEPDVLPSQAVSGAEYITLEAGWDTASKVTLGSGLSPVWQESDAIAVYDGTATQKFTLSASSGSTATFSGTMDTSADTYYAAYPYDSVTGFSSGSNKRFLTSIPSVQLVEAGDSTDASALVSVCRFALGEQLSFLQVAGLVKFTISVPGVKQVSLSSNGSEAMAADVVKVNPASGAASATTSSGVITLNHASGSFPVGNYYFAVLPGTFASGISLSISGGSSTVTKSSDSSVTIPRCGGINLGDVTAGADFSSGDLVITSDDGADTTDEDVVDNTTFARRIYVTFSSSGSATVSGAGSQGVTVSGNDVTIDNTVTDEKVIYELSGTTTDGFFKVYSNNKQAFVLNGVNITNKNGAAINNQGKKRCFVVVQGSNYLKDGSSYTDTPSEEDEKAAFFSEGQLVFSGSGSLSVTAVGKAGITSDDYVRFMSSPSVSVSSSAGHGVRGQDYVQISNGTLGVTTSANMKKGISSDDYVLVEGGTTTVKVTGGVAYDSEDAEYKGTAGVHADNYFAMTGGSLTITNSGRGGKGIRAGSYDYDAVNHTVADSYISGGTLSITTTGSESNDVSCKGIKIGWVTKSGSGDRAKVTGNAGNLLISGGSIVVSSSGSETVEVKGDLTISGGELYVSSTGDDAMNCQGEMNITGGYVYGYSTKNDAIDSNGNMKISGGYVYAVTTSGSPEVALDANTEGGYKLYIYSGATVVVYGGLESNYQSTSTFYSMNAKAGAWNSICNGSGAVIAAFKAPSGLSSFAVTGPSISTTAYKGVSVSGSALCNGVWAASSSGGTKVSLSEYKQQSGQGGDGNGRGGR